MSPAPAAARSARTAPPTRRRRLTSVRPPRRVSGPASGRAPQPASDGRILFRPLGAVGRGAARVARHPLVERMISGRWSIAVIAFALIGIVTLQLGLLKLNSGIGRALEREAALQRENAALSIENSELAAGNRVETQAGKLGMKLVPISSLQFRTADPAADVTAAAAALRQPVQSQGSHEAAQQQQTTASGESGAAEGAQGGEAGSTTTGGGSSSESATAAGNEGEQASGAAGTASPGGETQAGPPPSTPATPPTSEAGGGTAAPAG